MEGLGKRQRKKPKYLRDDEEEDEESSQTASISTSIPEDAASSHGTSHKHKPPKKKKSKKKSKSKKEDALESSPDKQPGIKMKLKLNKSPSSSTNNTQKPVVITPVPPPPVKIYESDKDVDVMDSMSDGEDNSLVIDDMSEPDEPIVTKRSKGSGNQDGDSTSDEEREWLEAIESGDIEDYERKKAARNPAILTARQRRLIHGEEDNSLLELPSQYKDKALTEEQLVKRQQRAVKRRQVAQEKSEKAKKLTVDRLLKKQEASVKGKSTTKLRSSVPLVSYRMTADQITLSIPDNTEFNILPSYTKPSIPKPIHCSIRGCKNLKKYSCSKTNVPLCSLKCYKSNLVKHAKLLTT